jgi:anaerobic selenocysteine-containing dehydrogenase
MERYWVPSDVESAVFGTKITDRFFQVQASGDVAFLHGTLKHMINERWLNDEFIRDCTTGFEELRDMLEQTSSKRPFSQPKRRHLTRRNRAFNC